MEDPGFNEVGYNRLVWRLDALDSWRLNLEERLKVIESEMVTEKDARHIREALKNQSRLRLTVAQRVAGIVLVGLAVADFVRGFVG